MSLKGICKGWMRACDRIFRVVNLAREEAGEELLILYGGFKNGDSKRRSWYCVGCDAWDVCAVASIIYDLGFILLKMMR